jgi:hypothetical protein
MQTKVLIRSLNFDKHYQHWLVNQKDEILNNFNQLMSDELLGEENDGFTISKTSSQTSLSWNDNSLPIDTFSFLMDYFFNLLTQNNYYKYMSDERVESSKSEALLSIYRHYLKPNVPYEETIKNNAFLLFGNITIEHRFNNNTNMLGITCNYYSQKQYDSFEKLMEILLKKTV